MSQIDNNLLINIRNEASGLSPILEKVGRFITENPDFVMRHTISELADSIDTSEGSITRFCRLLALKGSQTSERHWRWSAARRVQKVSQMMKLPQ